MSYRKEKERVLIISRKLDEFYPKPDIPLAHKDAFGFEEEIENYWKENENKKNE